MIKKEDIVNVTKHILRRQKGVPDRRLMHVRREWFISILAASLVFITCSVYAGSKFFKGINESEFRSDIDSGIIRYDQENISKALIQYSEKEKQFDTLRADTSKRAPIVETIEETTESNEETNEESENRPLADEIIGQ